MRHILNMFIYCPITVVKQSIRGWLRCSPAQNNKVDPGFYVGAPLPSFRCFLTMPLIFEKRDTGMRKSNHQRHVSSQLWPLVPILAALLYTLV